MFDWQSTWVSRAHIHAQKFRSSHYVLLKNIIPNNDFKKRFQILVSNSIDFIFGTVLTLPGILSKPSIHALLQHSSILTRPT